MSCCLHMYIRANVVYCQEKGVHFEAASLSHNGSFVRCKDNRNDGGTGRKLILMTQ